MKISFQNCIDEYNAQLSKSNQNIRIVKWQNNLIELSSGLKLTTEREKRVLRNRIASKWSISKIDKIYSYEYQADRDKCALDNRKAVSSKLNKKYFIEAPEEKKKKIIDNLIKHHSSHTRKGAKTNIPAWNKGLTKFTDKRLMEISLARIGSGNPMFGIPQSEENRKRSSDLMKSKIKNGEWTPNVHNSRTHWQYEFNGIKYRSSWEMMFAFLNPEYEFETIRIPYNIENGTNIYIVDFVDHNNKVLIEIKPSAHIKSFRAKQDAALKWCVERGYAFNIITEKYFKDNIDKIDNSILKLINFDHILKELKRQ